MRVSSCIPKALIMFGLVAFSASLSPLSFAKGKTPKGGSAAMSPQRVADMLQAIINADRTVYSSHVVNRLQDQQKVIKASEYYEKEKALPLPAQMFRMGAAIVAKQNIGITYALLSKFPISKQNLPRTPVEKEGLAAIAKNPKENFYKVEKLGKKEYFTAVYPDQAVAQACVTCHNDHKDSPKKDWKLNDNMGGVVIRIALD